VQKTALLAPLVGIFLALWDGYLAATAAAVPSSLGPAAALEGEVVGPAGVAAGGSSAAGSGSNGSGQSAVLQELAELADERFMASLRYLQVCAGAGGVRHLGNLTGKLQSTCHVQALLCMRDSRLECMSTW
jgi:hypothetical protein